MLTTEQIFDRPIDIDKPDYVVPLRNLSDPSDMYAFCRTHDISYYGYGFRYVRDSYQSCQLKFGLSAPDPRTKAKPKGERLVRQISYMPGWNKKVYSSTGIDFWEGCKNLIQQGLLPKNLNYTDIELAIWSGNSRTDISGANMSYKQVAAYIESELCDQYNKRHGKFPPLNIADTTRNNTFRLLTNTTFLHFFEESST